jgi:hypothetical protein
MRHFTVSLLLLLITLFLLGGCSLSKADTEQEAIVTFTQQALQIEAKRVELINWLGGHSIGLTPSQEWIMEKYYLNGVSPNTPNPPTPIPPSGLEGMSSLTNKLLLLDCPQSIQSIKDSLISIYNSEIHQFQLGQFKDTANGVDSSFFLEINWQNLDEWALEPCWLWNSNGGVAMRQMKDSAWYQLQSFRRDVFTQWSQLLIQHGIDPAKEGFTDLVLK